VSTNSPVNPFLTTGIGKQMNFKNRVISIEIFAERLLGDYIGFFPEATAWQEGRRFKLRPQSIGLKVGVGI
jgi:hypothetical protein